LIAVAVIGQRDRTGQPARIESERADDVVVADLGRQDEG
jgi:hypothetical protein